MDLFPHTKQLNLLDCGPTCLKMIADFHGKTYDQNLLMKTAKLDRKGSSLYHLMKAAKKIGLHTMGLKIDIERLNEISLPVIAHWNKSHFVVLFKIERDSYYIADPASHIITFTKSAFSAHWLGNEYGVGEGVVLTFSI